jgi:DNA replication licensing factor MCM3
MQIDTSSNQV